MEGVAAMRRTIWLSVVLPLVMGGVGTVVGQAVVLPALVAAQESRIRAEQVTVVGDNGAERVRMVAGPGISSAMQVLDANGTVRTQASTGRAGARTDVPDTGYFSVFTSAGTPGALLGLNRGPQGDRSLSSSLELFDQQARVRLRLDVMEDGSPSLRMMDATGNVVWSAP
jgi:hypothetical protein